MNKKRTVLTFAERMLALGKVGLKHSDSLRPDPRAAKPLEGLEREERLNKLIEILTKTER